MNIERIVIGDIGMVAIGWCGFRLTKCVCRKTPSEGDFYYLERTSCVMFEEGALLGVLYGSSLAFARMLVCVCYGYVMGNRLIG